MAENTGNSVFGNPNYGARASLLSFQQAVLVKLGAVLAMAEDTDSSSTTL